MQRQLLPALPPKMEHVQARVDELDKYGWLGTIDVLAGNDILKHAKIMSLSFERVITQLAMNRDVAAYNERLQKVYSDKNKTSK